MSNRIPRHSTRFSLDDYELALHKDTFLARLGFGRTNVAKRLINLSASGAQMMLSRPLPEGTPVRIRITVLRFGDVLDLRGEIRWMRQRNGWARVGVMFHEVDPSQEKLIHSMKGWFNFDGMRPRNSA